MVDQIVDLPPLKVRSQGDPDSEASPTRLLQRSLKAPAKPKKDKKAGEDVGQEPEPPRWTRKGINGPRIQGDGDTISAKGGCPSTTLSCPSRSGLVQIELDVGLTQAKVTVRLGMRTAPSSGPVRCSQAVRRRGDPGLRRQHSVPNYVPGVTFKRLAGDGLRSVT